MMATAARKVNGTAVRNAVADGEERATRIHSVNGERAVKGKKIARRRVGSVARCYAGR